MRNEPSVLLGASKQIAVGGHTVLFTPPKCEWWLRLADAVGMSLNDLAGDSSMLVKVFKAKKGTDKLMKLLAETTDKPPKFYLNELTLPQFAYFVDQWVGALDLDAAKGFFVEAGGRIKGILAPAGPSPD
jgi:hypothetical protein